MRAAAVALVLIVGAAVLLIFANTLNSWVLGGLIGGLAALLISIPISLFLFTILARRHDEELQALQEELEEMAAAEFEERAAAEVYETDAYVLTDEEEYYDEPRSRRLPGARSLPAAGQSQASASVHGMYNQRSENHPQGYRRSSQVLPQARGNGTPTRQLPPNHRPVKRSAYEVNAMRAKYQTAALRAARREAELQVDDVEVVPTSSAPPYKRASRPLSEQSTRFQQARPTRQLPPQQQTADPNRSRRVGNVAPGQQAGTRRNMSPDELNPPTRTPRTDSLRSREPQTDQLRDRSPETEPVYLRPPAGMRNPDMMTGGLKNPLVRRPPYTYEDDALRGELAQQIDGPIIRRSSRFLQHEEEE